MEMNLAQNIRQLRKQQNMTQEQLAESLDVTVGAVYKWEAGRSVPDVKTLMEMAILFGVSVDMLLGYELLQDPVSECVEKIRIYQREKQYTLATEEAEQALRRYPNNFRVVHRCGSMYQHFGMECFDPKVLSRAVELLERAAALLSQNTDREVNEMSIRTQIAMCYLSMEKPEKGIELLKAYNVMGINDSLIGYTLSTDPGMNPEEAIPYLTRAFLLCFSGTVHSMCGYANLFHRRGDEQSALKVLLWYDRYLESIRAENCAVSYIDRVRAQNYGRCAHFAGICGREEEGKQYLRLGYQLARKFDAAPNYHIDTIKFCVDNGEMGVASDDMGSSAVEAIDHALRADGDCQEEILALWEALLQSGSHSTDG